MDCSIFRKKLQDLTQENLSYDLREAMLEHAKNCKQCSALYNEEIEIDKMFETALSIDTQNFRSLRNDIMKNIDRKKYGSSPVKKLLRHLKNNMPIYTTLAAAVFMLAIIIPYVRIHGVAGTKKSFSLSVPQAANASKGNMDASKSVQADARNTLTAGEASVKSALNDEVRESAQESKKDEVYVPSFAKKTLDKNTAVKFNTPWENSKNNKFSASVEGKGSEALEEGIGTIIVKDVGSADMWGFSLLNNDIKQFSPKAVKWIDDENLLVIVGLGYGHFTQGGDLYILNINSAKAAKADPANTAKLFNKSEITKILSFKAVNSENLNIDVEVRVFDDSIYNASHRENRSIISPYADIMKIIR